MPLFDASVIFTSAPNQQNDVAAQFPDVVERLKQQSPAINTGVLKEASDGVLNWYFKPLTIDRPGGC